MPETTPHNTPRVDPGAVRAPEESSDRIGTRYESVRLSTEQLAAPLEVEDYVVQSMPDVSPTKWHLAHVTWFFETFVLMPHLSGYAPVDPAYQYLFNSYYLGAGQRHCRDQRGYLSRPTVDEVYIYRRHVDRQMSELLERVDANRSADAEEIRRVVEIGLHHEQQHQELLLTDIKHVLSVNPLRPAYLTTNSEPAASHDVGPISWIPTEGALFEVGHEIESGFAFDNETPRHRYFVEDFELADRLVTNAEFMAFIEDGGYTCGDLWLSEGWAAVQSQGWREPFYWERKDGDWHIFTLRGQKQTDPLEPVCHLNYFEADAYARWAGARLPSEQEWEVVAARQPIRGNFVESGLLHPTALADQNERGPAAHQIFGDVWEWTRSQYSPYPGYEALPGTLGEYNGKFMSNQFVLRGGSCATSASHIRHTYRNFFPADASWQFTGVRLARDV